MAFGTIMEFDLNDKVRVQMAPLNRSDMSEFVKDGAMQSHQVLRYLGHRMAQVEENEYEWFDRVRGEEDTVTWGIYIIQDGKRSLIGSTSLMSIQGGVMKRATSGILIFRQEWWGKGVAKASHNARTWYAFNQLGLTHIRSCHFSSNKASRKATIGVGYVQVGVERNALMVDGKWEHQHNMECINPADWAWDLWWGNDKPPKRFVEGRKLTIKALEWAEKNVSCP